MQPPLLYGTYDVTLDADNRLRLAGELRKLLDDDGEGLVLICLVGSNGKLWLYPERRWLAATGGSEVVKGRDGVEIVYTRVEVDRRGWLELPGELRRRRELGREITLVGCMDHVQFWDREEWHRRSKEMDASRAAIFKAAAERCE